MSKRTFLRKSAITLAATLSLGGPAVYSADIVLNNSTHNVGTRTILANNALHGAYYDPTANPPQGSFDSVSALRAYEAAEITAGTAVITEDLKYPLDFDQGKTEPPFFPHNTNDSLFSIWSGEVVVAPGAGGTYRFDSASDDGTVGFVDGAYIVQNNFYQGRTQRNFTFNLTEGPHPIVMAWYEGGSGANGTFWLYKQGNAATIVNPAAPPAGISFRKVEYKASTTDAGMNVLVGPGDGTLEIAQDTPIAFGSLSLADGKSLTVNSITSSSFTETKMGATGTLNVTGGRTITGPITSSGPITTLRKTGGGTVEATSNSKASNFTAASTLEITGGNFVGLSRGAGATPPPSSIGDAKIVLNGGTFTGRGVIFDTPGADNKVGVTFFAGTSATGQIDPIDAGIGLLTRSDGKRVEYGAALAFDDDNPDFGHPNFADVSGGAVGVDNLQVLGYGRATFVSGPGGDNTYSFGNWSDDGVTLFIDLDNDGRFESGDNGSGKNELVFTDNSFHAPRVAVTPAPVTIPPGSYRFATGFYEGGGNAVMDFRIARGNQTATSYDELKANFSQIDPSDTSIISKITSLTPGVNADFTVNPISVSGNSGLAGDGASKIQYGTVTIADGSVLTTSGPIAIANTIVNGTARMNTLTQPVDIGKLQPGTPGANFTLLSTGTLDLRGTTNNNALAPNATVGVGGGRLQLAGATATSPSSIGNATVAMAGGTLVAHGQFAIAETVGATNQLTEYFYNFAANPPESIIDPIFAPTGLFGMTPNQTLALTGALMGLNDAEAQIRWGDQDTLGAMWYGEMTFKSEAGTGNQYTFGSNTDDGSTWWVDINNDGKFAKADGELVLNNNFYQGPTFRRGVANIPPGTHRVALAAYEGGGGMLFDFLFGRGDLQQAELTPVDPTDTSIATYRARTYAPADVVTPSFATNPVTVSADTTIEAVGAASFGATTFTNNATVNVTQSGTSFASATANAGVTGTLRNSVGNNRMSVGDVGAAAGGTLALGGNDSKVTGSITGAGTVRLDRGVIEFSKSGAAASGTPTLSISPLTTARFTPGSGNTFGAAAVSAITQNGTLHAANGVVDLSGATVTTTLPAGTVTGAGLANVTGDFYDGATVPTAQNSANTFGWAGLDTKAAFDAALAGKATLATRAINNLEINFPRGNGSLVDGGTNDFGVEQIFNVDGANLNVPLAGNDDFVVRFRGKVGVSSAGPTGFGMAANDGAVMFLDLDQGAGENWVKVADHNRFSTTGGGAFDEHGTAGAGNPGAPAIPQPAQPNLAVGAYDFIVGFYNANANEAGIELYWDPAGPDGRSIIPTGTVVAPSVVQIDGGVTLKVGALIDIASVNLAATGRLELHNGTSKLAVSALPIPGGPGR